MGRARRDPLVPIFRSEAQGRVLAALLLASPDDPTHVSGIAARTGLPFSTVQREIDRLEDSGIVTSERFAGARVVRPRDDSPLIDDLRSLVLKAYGPLSVLSTVLSEIDGIEEAYVFGSWAARYLGEMGPAPEDVDVLVIGNPVVDDVYDACSRAEDLVGRPVQPTVISRDEWNRAASGFLATIRERPLVSVDLER